MKKLAQELFYTLNKETNNGDDAWNVYIVLNDGWYMDKFITEGDKQAIEIFYKDYINKK